MYSKYEKVQILSCTFSAFRHIRSAIPWFPFTIGIASESVWKIEESV